MAGEIPIIAASLDTFAMTRRLLLAFTTFAAACSSAPPKPLTVNDLPDIDTAAVLTDIKKLSSDEFEGRLPGTKGEQLAVEYLMDQFKAAGLEPGNPGRHLDAEGAARRPHAVRVLAARGQEGRHSAQLQGARRFVAFSKHVTDAMKLEDSEIVFAGYGVQAPEFQWDDFKGVDVKGKTHRRARQRSAGAATRRSDELDPKIFGGKRDDLLRPLDLQVREGRRARRRRAASSSTRPIAPGTPSTSCRDSAASGSIWCTPDKNMTHAAKSRAGCRSTPRQRCSRRPARTIEELKAQAATREFKPVPLGMTASFALKQKMRTIDSQNVDREADRAATRR